MTLPYEDSVGYLASIIGIFLFIGGTVKVGYKFIEEFKKLPAEFSNINKNYEKGCKDIKNLRDKVNKMEGQIDVCYRIVSDLISK